MLLLGFRAPANGARFPTRGKRRSGAVGGSSRVLISRFGLHGVSFDLLADNVTALHELKRAVIKQTRWQAALAGELRPKPGSPEELGSGMPSHGRASDKVFIRSGRWRPRRLRPFVLGLEYARFRRSYAPSRRGRQRSATLSLALLAWYVTDWGIGLVRSFTYRLYVFHGIAYPRVAASSCPVPGKGTGRVVARLVVGPVTAFPGRSLRWLRSLDFRAWCLAALTELAAREPCGRGFAQERRPGFYTGSPQPNPTRAPASGSRPNHEGAGNQPAPTRIIA